MRRFPRSRRARRQRVLVAWRGVAQHRRAKAAVLAAWRAAAQQEAKVAARAELTWLRTQVKDLERALADGQVLRTAGAEWWKYGVSNCIRK